MPCVRCDADPCTCVIGGDCIFCGLGVMVPPVVYDGNEYRCECGAAVVMSVDAEDTYVSHYLCKHGKRDDEPCTVCDAEQPQ